MQLKKVEIQSHFVAQVEVFILCEWRPSWIGITEQKIDALSFNNKLQSSSNCSSTQLLWLIILATVVSRAHIPFKLNTAYSNFRDTILSC